MEMGQIEAFVEIARQGSITRAAEKLYLTQPTVTSRLKSLEREVGESLCTRVPRGIILTDAGRLLLPYAERALQALSEGQSALRHQQEATGGSLFIGSATLISTYLLPTLLLRFAQAHPDVHVVVRSGHTQDIVERILHQDVQIGLVYQMSHPDIATQLVHEDELAFVAQPAHPLFQRDDVSLQEIASEPHILLGGHARHFRAIQEIFASAGVETPPARFEVDSVEVAKKIVESGQGIALLHRITIQHELESGALKVIPCQSIPRMSRPIFAIHHRMSGLGGIARAFLKTVQDLQSSL